MSVAPLLLAGCQRSAPLRGPGSPCSRPRRGDRSSRPHTRFPACRWRPGPGPRARRWSLYRTLPAPGGSPAMIAEALANRLENLPGLRRGRPSDGKGRRDDRGAGRGGRAGHRQRPGTQRSRHTDRSGWQDAGSHPRGDSGFPQARCDALPHLGCPESSYDRIAPDIKATLETVRFTSSGQPSFSGY